MKVSLPSGQEEATHTRRRARTWMPPTGAREIAERALRIAAGICIYTNTEINVEELDERAHQPAQGAEMTPREVVAELDKYIIGQEKAKKAVAIALATVAAAEAPGGAPRRGGAEEHHHDRPTVSEDWRSPAGCPSSAVRRS